MSRLRVVVADDHPVFREGLAQLLARQPDVDVVAAYGDGASTLAALRDDPPDVAVVDLRLPDIDGIELVETLSGEGTGTRVVILTAYVDSASVYRAVAAGARAYLEKSASLDSIVDAVRQVAEGGTVISPLAQTNLADELRSRESAARPKLTGRETEILTLAAEGRSTQQIAADLHIGMPTVKTHLQHVYEKLDVSDRAAAVARAIRLGLFR